ncbi:McrC family protein [Rhodococcus erythropolis]|uniref:McrC family protein n=1 Tax=Rhodococcus erythropolis TaxID=1833 RepID=UPI0022280A90|nr:McrC family protein [Rhodococcus erythropolis]MCW2295538.1 5-methylcytosine-specific restriction enzyme subunit McrC [Rhodococcus erythropolis]
MGYVRDPAWWSQHTALADTDTDLVAALAEAFVVAAERATARGLLSGYREVEDSGPVLRGRPRAGDQITRRFFARTAGGDPLRRIRAKTSPKTSCCSPPPRFCSIPR